MPTRISERPLDVESTLEQWQVLRGLNIYRWALALLILGLNISEVSTQIFSTAQPEVLRAVANGYIAFCLFISLLISTRRPGATKQIFLHLAGDLAAILGLMVATGGIQSGAGMLLIAPTAAASLLLSRRMSVLVASVASLSILGETVYGQLRSGFNPAELSQTGILGLLIFLSALVANGLASRAKRSEAFARQAGIDLRDLANLNERIIQRMETGVIALSADAHVQLINGAAKDLLGIRGIAAGRPLAQLSPALAERISISDAVSTQQRVNIGGRVLVPSVSQVGRGRGLSTLIFLEDGARAASQAQQMKLAALGTLTASIAHEVRNPLGAISHASQLLAESESAAATDRNLFDIISRHADRINTIVENVLGLARQGDVAVDTLVLKAWLEGFHRIYADGLATAPDIVLNEVDEQHEVDFDPSHLQQVIGNLWDNALRHGSGEPPRITLRSGQQRGVNRVFLDVENSGDPIPSDVVGQMFDPFFTRDSGGSGLGLYIARELCELNGAVLSYNGAATGPPVFRILFSEPGQLFKSMIPT